MEKFDKIFCINKVVQFSIISFGELVCFTLSFFIQCTRFSFIVVVVVVVVVVVIVVRISCVIGIKKDTEQFLLHVRSL